MNWGTLGIPVLFIKIESLWAHVIAQNRPASTQVTPHQFFFTKQLLVITPAVTASSSFKSLSDKAFSCTWGEPS